MADKVEQETETINWHASKVIVTETTVTVPAEEEEEENYYIYRHLTITVESGIKGIYINIVWETIRKFHHII